MLMNFRERDYLEGMMIFVSILSRIILNNIESFNSDVKTPKNHETPALPYDDNILQNKATKHEKRLQSADANHLEPSLLKREI